MSNEIIDFRGDPLLASDANVQQEIESLVNYKFKLVKQIQEGVKLSFTIKDFRISSLTIN
ncbi:hypothetical protein LCGC14_2797690, partial [marine sediment metagenome]